MAYMRRYIYVSLAPKLNPYNPQQHNANISSFNNLAVLNIKTIHSKNDTMLIEKEYHLENVLGKKEQIVCNIIL
jgi:hypothetical protein